MVLTRQNCTREQAERFSSRTSAWRLFTGRVDKIRAGRNINPDFTNIKIPLTQIYRYASGVLINYVPVTNPYFQDIVGDAVCSFLEKSGDHPGTSGALGSIVYFTMLDWFTKKKFIRKEVLCLDRPN